MLGVLVWPYQHASWDAERLRRLAAHCRTLDHLGPPLIFDPNHFLLLADLSSVFENLCVVIGQQQQWQREGSLTVNLFLDDLRIYTIAFSLYDDPAEGRTALIGGMQGSSRQMVTETYRDLTKAFFGLRPRDLLLEFLRSFCRRIAVENLLAVSDAGRIHRHPYFGKKSYVSQEFDVAWADRGGIPTGDDLFKLPLSVDKRRLEQIKPNKRSMYRKRYEFLDRIDRQLTENFHRLPSGPISQIRCLRSDLAARCIEAGAPQPLHDIAAE